MHRVWGGFHATVTRTARVDKATTSGTRRSFFAFLHADQTLILSSNSPLPPLHITLYSCFHGASSPLNYSVSSTIALHCEPLMLSPSPLLVAVSAEQNRRDL
jgi:hypothetical protein